MSAPRSGDHRRGAEDAEKSESANALLPSRGRGHREEELDEEIRAHLEMAIADRVARGESHAEAERNARREFGNEARVKEVTRSKWRGAWFDQLAQDVHFGWRTLLRNPGFALTAIVVLTIGIGANATIYTLSHRLLTTPPPAVSASEDLVGIRWTPIDEGGDDAPWMNPNYEFLRDHADAFSGVLAYDEQIHAAAVAQGERISQSTVGVVSDNFFAVLGTPMTTGRGFLPEENRTPKTHPVAILSHGLWQRMFNGAPDVLGQAISINGHAFTVVGVTDAEFRGIDPTMTPPDLYVPIMMTGVLMPGGDELVVRHPVVRYSVFQVVGRLAEGVTREAAQTNLETVQAALKGELSAFYGTNVDLPVRIVVSPDFRYNLEDAGRVRMILRLLSLVGAGVLLIGGANLAILLLARASARIDEIGVRTAIGAGRQRLLRQLMTESLLLAGFGVLGGLAVAYFSARAVSTLLPYSLGLDPSPDGRVIALTALLGLLVTVGFGLAPALRLSGTDLASVTRKGNRTADRGLLRGGLVVGQIAISTLLVAGSVLFLRSMLAAKTVDLGFDPSGKTIARVELANHGYDRPRGEIFIEEVLEALRTIPGVDNASVASTAPFLRTFGMPFRAPGSAREELIPFSLNDVGQNYFAMMGISVVAGRAFGPADGPEAPQVVIVNETAARQIWPGENPIGKTLEPPPNPLVKPADPAANSTGKAAAPPAPRAGLGPLPSVSRTVVGVVRDGVYASLAEPPRPFAYVPIRQSYRSGVTLVVESTLPSASLASAISSAVAGIDPTVAVSGIRPLSEIVAEQTESYRILAILLSSFGLAALLLAAVGLYGVQSYLVGRRSHEIGIRMALGAHAREVAGAVLRGGAVLTIAGLAIGLGAAVSLGGLVRGLLFGVQPNDPTTFIVVLITLFVAALAASYLPARRASRVDPMVALREG